MNAKNRLQLWWTLVRKHPVRVSINGKRVRMPRVWLTRNLVLPPHGTTLSLLPDEPRPGGYPLSRWGIPGLTDEEIAAFKESLDEQ